MSPFAHPVVQGLIYRIGWTLAHSVWQATLAAMLLAIVLRIGRGWSASTRYLIGCAALVGIVLAATVTSALVASPPAQVRFAMEVVPVVDVLANHAPEPSAASSHAAPEAFDFVRLAHVSLPYCVAAWATGVLALAVARSYGWNWLRRMRRAAAPAEASWQSRLDALSSQLGVRRRVLLAAQDHLDIPIVLGVLRPMILAPVSLLNGLSIEQVEAILAHELAHVRRHDYLANLIQSAIETLLFYHPAVWWISKQIRRERECACDDIAAAACGDRAGYADALASLDQHRSSTRNTIRLAPAADPGSPGELLVRVRRLLGNPSSAAPRAAPVAAGSWGALAILVLAVALVPVIDGRSRAQTTTVDAGASPTTRPGEPSDDPELKLLLDRISRYESSISELKMAIDTQSKVYGDNYPPMVQLRRMAEAYEAEYHKARQQYVRLEESHRNGPAPAPAVEERDAPDANAPIAANDLLRVKIGDLTGPGIESTRLTWVSDRGLVSLPVIGPLTVAGMSVRQAEGAIRQAYRDARLIQNAPVSVQVIRPTTDGDRSVLEELRRQDEQSAAEHKQLFDEVQQQRQRRLEDLQRQAEETGKEGERREAAAAAAAATQPALVPLHVIVGREQIFLNRNPVDWNAVRAAIQEVPMDQRRATFIALSAQDAAVPVERFFEAQAMAQRLAHDFAMANVSVWGVEPDPNEQTYFIGGHVERGGVYTLTQRPVTLKQALKMAGLPAGEQLGGDMEVVFIRRTAGQNSEDVVRIPFGELFSGKVKDPMLRAGDQIMLNRRGAN